MSQTTAPTTTGAPTGGSTTVREVVLTGGPCAGKTTAMAEVAERLRAEGWRVLVVPEAATMFIEGGVSDIAELAADPVRMGRFQRALISTQGALRHRYRALAAALGDERCVILYDRAECDAAAYVPSEWFAAALAAEGTSLLEVRDSYDAVVHLRSAAVGAPDAYSLESNPARRETVDEAAALDEATLAAWVGHHRLTIVGNYDDFADKVDRTFVAVAAALGEPAPLEVERKFVCLAEPDQQRLVSMPVVEIVQTYLRCDEPGAERRVRRMFEPVTGAVLWTETVKRRVAPSVRVEDERVISALEATELLCDPDPERVPVRKLRRAFVDGDRTFVLDELISPRRAWVLEAELLSPEDEVLLPAWLPPLLDVTDDSSWSMRNVAAAPVA
jgi:predicted ATPase